MKRMVWSDFAQDLKMLGKRGMRKSIDNMRQALERLQNPEKTYPIVHVAGTNGKGSSCTFLASILAQNGYKVGLALSPHVETFHERLQLLTPDRLPPQSLITTDELLALHAHLQELDPDCFGLTYFEYSLLLALEWFRAQKVDLVVLETGMGGRWDATNACPSVVSGIVSVGLDHMQELGATKEKILAEKIAIAKPNTDFVFAPLAPDLVELARAFCLEKDVEFFASATDIPFLQNQSFHHWPQVFRHNLQFAATLAMRLQAQGFVVKEKNYALHLPVCRYETLQESPVIFLDGAHNEPALRALKLHLQNRWGEAYDLAFGCLKDRDAVQLAQWVLPKAGEMYWLTFKAFGRESKARVYENLMQNYGGYVFDLDAEFVAKRLRHKHARPLVVCGSFYLCGQFRDLWQGCRKSFL